PPPPTPTTLMRAPVRRSSASFSRISLSSMRSRNTGVTLNLSAINRPSSPFRAPCSEELPEESPNPPGHPAERSGSRSPPRFHRLMVMAVLHQSHGRREPGAGNVVGQPAHARRHPPPDRQVEDLLGDL